MRGGGSKTRFDGGAGIVYGRRGAYVLLYPSILRRLRSLYLGNGIGDYDQLVYSRGLQLAKRYRDSRGALTRAT